jgi:tetratricopeptide (TPR) repeat protein
MRSGLRVFIASLLLIPLWYFTIQRACQPHHPQYGPGGYVSNTNQSSSSGAKVATAANSQVAPASSVVAATAPATAPAASAETSVQELMRPPALGSEPPMMARARPKNRTSDQRESPHNSRAPVIAAAKDEIHRMALPPYSRARATTATGIGALIGPVAGRGKGAAIGASIGAWSPAGPPDQLTTLAYADPFAAETPLPAKTIQFPLHLESSLLTSWYSNGGANIRLKTFFREAAKAGGSQTSGATAVAAAPNSTETPFEMTSNRYEQMLSTSLAFDVAAVTHYNLALNARDDKVRVGQLQEFETKLRQAVVLSSQALELAQSSPRPTNPQEGNEYYLNRLLALATRAQSLSLLARTIDHSEKAGARQAFLDYIAFETDSQRRLRARRLLAQTLLDAGDLEAARTQFAELVLSEPRDREAKGKLGLILFDLGTLKKNEGKSEEGANDYQRAAVYLQEYLGASPEPGALTIRASSVLETLTRRPVPSPNVPAQPRRP